MSSPGSTDRPGYLYHQPAFPIDGVRLHRSDNRHRLGMLLRGHNWINQHVLDLGCNVGYFSIMLALQGARVTGVDLDRIAIEIANEQAVLNGLDVTFLVPEENRMHAKKRRWMGNKDVLIAFSVLPWIYATEENPKEYVAELFKIPMAFIEIQYPPDGRASVPGVVDDRTCREYLERYYSFVFRIGETIDETDGVKRVRTMWHCVAGNYAPRREIYGSQGMVEIKGDYVIKTRRPEKEWDPAREARALRILQGRDVAPELHGLTDSSLTMRLIHGVPLTASDITTEQLRDQLYAIAAVLERYGVQHNDIRPENILVGANKRVRLIDFGWSTINGEPRPERVNPLYPGTDRDAIEKILRHHPAWSMCG